MKIVVDLPESVINNIRYGEVLTTYAIEDYAEILTRAFQNGVVLSGKSGNLTERPCEYCDNYTGGRCSTFDCLYDKKDR